ncbi:PH domain-containing protein [Mycena sanguinolenta]|uniref:PH domain-containing protein n=1 Tax=Mycena sanguinolenta TaxID=230812 RepID=A0A8H6ZFP3_9AGAR|nr:PH domain-containing protein [Mycena sanguinolenta]
MNHEAASISRATSISRASKQGSTMSRSQSLIKKNIAPHDLRPSDILIERFVAWKAIVKQLIAYFEGVADIHNNTAKELTKLGAVIQVPFRAGNQFLGEGGLQDIYYDVRDKTRVIADQHANLGRTIDSSIVQHLQKLRTEIKAHIKNVQNDTGKLATSVAKERELSTRLISELSSDISAFKNTPMAVTSKTDPYVANAAVVRQLTKQVHEENLLQKSIIIMQQNSAHFEEGIVRAIQSAWQTYDEWQARMGTSIATTHTELTTHMASLAPDREWLAFSGRSDHLLDPETPLRNPATIVYPSKDDPSVLAVHTGLMERKKRYTRTYRESFFVLTPAGFLHEYASSDPMAPGGREPLFSLFLPMCTLGPPSSASARSHKFHIEGRKDGSGTTKSGSAERGDHAWSFRARSREDMMEWWNDIRMLCARYLVASEQMERSGPVAAAVRAAGYVSEEEEEGETDEGSSVEEEDEGDGLEYADADEGAGPPSYSHPRHSMEMGANGFPIEKKGHGRQPSTSGDGANLSRRPSKRQQEKAPERPAAEDAEADGKSMPGGESRFVESA